MCAPRFAALFVLVLACFANLACSQGRLEIADLTYEVDQVVVQRMRRKYSFRIEVEVCRPHISKCDLAFKSYADVGKPLEPIVFEEPEGISWNGYNLRIRVYNKDNHIYYTTNVRKTQHTNRPVFLEHDWEDAYIPDGLNAVRFRHRLVCGDGFTGVYCNRRIEVPSGSKKPENSDETTTATTTVTPQHPEEATRLSTSNALDGDDLFRLELVVAAVVVVVVIVLLGLALIGLQLTRSTKNSETDFEKECTVSVITSTSSLSSLDNERLSTLIETEEISEKE